MAAFRAITGRASQRRPEDLVCDHEDIGFSLGESLTFVSSETPDSDRDGGEETAPGIEGPKWEPLQCERVRASSTLDQAKTLYQCRTCGHVQMSAKACERRTASKPSKTLRHAERRARSRCQLARQRYMDQCNHVHLSSQIYLQSVRSPTTDPRLIDTAHFQFTNDDAELNERHQALQQAEEHLDSIERHIYEEEDRTEARRTSVIRTSYQEAVLDDDASEVSEASTKTAPVLKKHFILAGNVFVLEERLTELDLNHQEAGAASPLSFDQAPGGGERLYQQKRLELLDKLEIGRCRLQESREACLVQGLDPERFRYRRISGQSRKDGPLSEANTRDAGPANVYDIVSGWLQQDIND